MSTESISFPDVCSATPEIAHVRRLYSAAEYDSPMMIMWISRNVSLGENGDWSKRENFSCPICMSTGKNGPVRSSLKMPEPEGLGRLADLAPVLATLSKVQHDSDSPPPAETSPLPAHRLTTQFLAMSVMLKGYFARWCGKSSVGKVCLNS
jgi:hypothetical protein